MRANKHNGLSNYDLQCFRCARCHQILPYEQPFFEVDNKPHCKSCSDKAVSSPSPIPRSTKPLSSHSTPLFKSSSIRESQPYPNVLTHRSRPLPKLGGSKICPRCRTSIAISEDTPGPRASRWHKKCLRCIGCRKQLDSGAKVIEGEHGEWVVRCRSCMVCSPLHIDKNVFDNCAHTWLFIRMKNGKNKSLFDDFSLKSIKLII